MPNLVVLRGYSASGKSTWARDEAAASADSMIIVSRDTVRRQITGRLEKTRLSPELEEIVSKIEYAQIETALSSGLDVISDNTNLNPQFTRKYLDIAADLGASWRVVDFPVSLDECLLRDRQRAPEERVPHKIIEQQARKWPFEKWKELRPGSSHFKMDWEPYVHTPGLPPAYAFDIDGTLAHAEGVRHIFDPTRYRHDHVDEHVRNVLWGFQYTLGDGEHSGIVIFTGRDEKFREDTEWWLRQNEIYDYTLYMRPEGDKRRDDIVKSEMLDRCGYNILGVFDDRMRVLRMWHARGVKTFKVGDPDGGNF